jgi:outer membrane protein assembly factor BamB
VWTIRYDNARTGANTNETTLTVANVGGGRFGLLFSRMVDGQLYAQPLYLPQLTIGGAVHNVVFVATEHNTVYAFDADDPAAGTPLWSKNLGPSMPLSPSPDDVQPVPPPYNVSCKDMAPEVGITSTPVIDTANGRIYVVAKTQESGKFYQRLHALDVRTGEELLGGPVAISGSVPGTGDGASGGMVAFDPQRHLNRPGLLLYSGAVFIAFSSHCDNDPYHGWIFAYDSATLAQKGIFNDTANGAEGGIWQSGMGLTANADGIFFVSGNGDFDPAGAGAMTGISVGHLRLSSSGLTLADFWTPRNASQLNTADYDFTTAAVLLPDPNAIVMGGKDGNLNLLDPANLGGFHADTNRVLQQVSVGGHTHGGPVYWQGPSGPTLYIWPETQGLKAYRFSAGKLPANPTAQYTDLKPEHPGGILSISSNGAVAGTGILWATTQYPANGDAWHSLVPGALYAFDATTLTRIWSSTTNTQDTLGTFAKFNAPVVINGKVYVGTHSNALRVYGLN